MTEEQFDPWHTIRTEPSKTRSRTNPSLEGTPVPLGQVTCPSGVLLVVDLGLGLGGFGSEALRPLDEATTIQQILRAGVGAASVGAGSAGEAIALGGIPVDSPLQVFGIRTRDERATFLWRCVYLDVRPGAEIERSEYLGSITTDYSLMLFGDLVAIREWHQIEPVDGKADINVWGFDAEIVAREIGALYLSDELFGWSDCPSDEAESRAEELARDCRARGLRVLVATAAHSHHYYITKQIFSADTKSGTLEVGGAQMCGWRTGMAGRDFMVIRDLDDRQRVVRVRIHPDLETDRE
jgi:hypothetical protein